MLQCGFVRSNFALPMGQIPVLVAVVFRSVPGAGAGDGNRTHVASLEGWSSTIELHPPDLAPSRLPTRAPPPRLPSERLPTAEIGGGGRIRTFEDRSRQIYSLLPLTARQPLLIACRRAQRVAVVKVSGSDCQQHAGYSNGPNQPRKSDRNTMSRQRRPNRQHRTPAPNNARRNVSPTPAAR